MPCIGGSQGQSQGQLSHVFVRSLCTRIGQVVRAVCPNFVGKYRTMPDLKRSVADRIADTPTGHVWAPVDFLDLGSRDAVDKPLQRLVHAGQLRRIDRGLYDTPWINSDEADKPKNRGGRTLMSAAFQQVIRWPVTHGGI